jgi:hypothetical protein
VGAGVPVATTLKVAVCPTVTLFAIGCVVMVGATFAADVLSLTIVESAEVPSESMAATAR